MNFDQLFLATVEKFISIPHLSSLASKSLTESRTIYAHAEKVRKRSKQSDEISIFLSHSHSEKETLERVIYLLSKLGVNIT